MPKRHQSTGNEIVGIRRQDIKGTVYGLIVDESDKLLLLHRIVEFRPDGLMVLDKADITRIIRDRTGAFQTRLMRHQGTLPRIKRQHAYDLRSWRHFFRSLHRQHAKHACHLIVEAERGDDPLFCMGVLHTAKRRHLKLLEFSGTARWYPKPSRISYRDISNCQIGSHYQQVYADYLAGKR